MLLVMGSFLFFTVDVIRADILVLLGPDVMVKCAPVLDFHSGEVHYGNAAWRMRMLYHLGHTFVCSHTYEKPQRVGKTCAARCPGYTRWTQSQRVPYISLPECELTKLHIQFYHHSAGKLFSLSKYADHRRVTGEIRMLVGRISRSCDASSSFST